MTAQLVMDATQVAQDQEGWLARRLEGITASEMALVMNVAPGEWGGPFSLYHAKLTGQSLLDNDAMMRGRYLEPYVLERFSRDWPGFEMHPGGLHAHPDRPWQMATFDALAVHGAGWKYRYPVQAKTSATFEGYGPDGSDVIPVQYRAQGLWEMDTEDTDTVYVPTLFIVPWQIRTYILHRDAQAQRDIMAMRLAAEVFRGMQARQVPPPVDWTPETTRTLKRLYPGLEDRAQRIPLGMARRYKAARKSRARAERRVLLYVNQIRDRMGSAQRAVIIDPVTGREETVVTRSIYDTPPYQVAGGTTDKLNPCKWLKGA